ncbi:MAG: PqqD family protein [Clostridiales Family XIII bacterium]|jgi:hypothetical protein|nr:PqqD family protein [Clostridiales Family XIII bacterium]
MNYELCEGVTIEHIDGHNVLVAEKGDVAVLNRTASCILDNVLDDGGIENAVKSVLDKYSTDGDTARADAEEFIAGLAEKKLIKFGSE